MRNQAGAVIFSPSDLVRYLASPFASWLDRCHLENPGVFIPDEEREQQKLLAQAGDEHEVRLVAFTEYEVVAQGFPLYCRLRDIITEIVIGPSADFDFTVATIGENAPDLRGIPITRSKLAPN